MNNFMIVLIIVSGVVIFLKYYENPNATERLKCPKCGKRKGVLAKSFEGERYQRSNIHYIDSHRTFICQSPECGYTWEKTVPEKIG